MTTRDDTGFAVLCDARGGILTVFHDPGAVFGQEDAVGFSLARFFAPASTGKLLGFIVNAKLAGAAYGCEVVLARGREHPVYELAGLAAGGGIFVIGVSQSNDFEQMLTSMTGVCNTHSNEIRALIKERQHYKAADQELYEELSRLNNQLINAQRDAAKKNAALEKANARVEELMRTDQLTGVGNRRLLDERLGEAVSFAQRHTLPLSIAMIDVDHFKLFNDTHGHEAGDAVLRGLGKLLRRETRQEDITARFGGEEFVVMMPGTDTDGARTMAERIRCAFENTEIDPRYGCATASFGVAHLREDDSPESLLARADRALYAAKEAGRNRTVVEA